MYYIIYETTNSINGKKYRGKHETNAIDDGYLGSGLWLKRAVKQYGKHNFSRDIIFMAFDRKGLFWAEEILVDLEWLSQGPTKVYNLRPGGNGGFFKRGLVSVVGKQVTKEEFDADASLSGVAKDKIPVFDRDGNALQVSKNDIRLKTKELVPCVQINGTVPCCGVDGKIVKVTKEAFLSGKYSHVTAGTANVRDKNGNVFRVRVNDPRLLSGELVGHTKGISNNFFCYKIYDSNNNLMFVCIKGEFREFLKQHKLPSVLVKSYQSGGTPILTDIGSNKRRLLASNRIQYVGWYCIKEKIE